MSTSPSYLNGKLLLATPSIGDHRFHRAVLFMVSHNVDGAMGLMINFPLLGLTFADLLTQTGVPLPDKPSGTVKILSGGPMETGHGFLLHTSDYEKPETMKVTPHFSVTATIDALQDVANGFGPKESLFILGYAGWDAGQLEREIAENAWAIVDSDHELLFNTLSEELWNRAYGRLGVDPALLSSESGRA